MTDARSVEGPVDSALSLRSLSVDVGQVPAVRDVSLEARAGEFITLLGPSGCGKTSTLRAVAGYLKPTRGEVLIAGRRVTDVSPQQRRIGMVFQNYALFPHMTVAENVAFPLKQLRRSRADIARRVQEMLELVRLPDFHHRMPRQLSGGQQQRVALARALAFAPALLLLDEPLSALDRHLREEMQGELKRIQRELGVTTLFVTHDQSEALAMSDRIAVMRAGRIEQIGSPQEIYERPANPFVASFVGSMQFVRGEVIASAADRACVRLAGTAAILECSTGGRALSGNVLVGLRPENVRAVSGNASGGAAGIVKSVQYRGARCDVELELGGAVRIHGVDYGRRVQPGERVTIEWEPVGMVCFSTANDSGEPSGALAGISTRDTSESPPGWTPFAPTSQENPR